MRDPTALEDAAHRWADASDEYDRQEAAANNTSAWDAARREHEAAGRALSVAAYEYARGPG